MACLSLYRNYYKATLLQSCILCANVKGKAERQKKQEQSTATMPSVVNSRTHYSTEHSLAAYKILTSAPPSITILPGLLRCLSVQLPVHTRTPRFSPQSSSQAADMCVCFFLTFPVSTDSIITYLRMKHPIWPKVGTLKYLRISKLAKFNKSEFNRIKHNLPQLQSKTNSEPQRGVGLVQRRLTQH